jgi:tripartite-type tricarboxylate transporter receptor subunit TctC
VTRRRTALQFAGALCVQALTPLARAQGKYPDRAIRIIVALPAGGSVDMIARLLGQKLTAALGQPVIGELFF